MRFVLFYDNLIRDYRGLLFLQTILNRMGHHTWLAPLWRDPLDTIREYNPDTVVMGQAGEETTSGIARFVRDNRINLVLNTTENVCYEHRREYFFKVNFREWNDSVIDLQVIISRDFNRYIQDHISIKDKSKYKFIGCPRFDLSVNPELCIQETESLKNKYQTHRFNRKLLYISSFIFDESGGQASEENYDYINVPLRFKREMTQKRQHHEIITQLLLLLKKNNDVLLIKRHPWDKSRFYQDYYCHENIILIDNFDYISPLLQISDVVLHTESTVAVEGWIQGKKTISILPDFDGDRSKLKNHMQYEPVATDFDSLYLLIEDYPWENTAKSLENYKPYTDGKATIRLARLLDELPSKSEKTRFKIKDSERIALKRQKMEQRLLYAQQLNNEPKDGYTYHYLYLEQFRRKIDAFYTGSMRRFVADKAKDIMFGRTGPVNGVGDLSTESTFEILQQAEDLVAQEQGSKSISLIEKVLDREPDSAAAHALFACVLTNEAKLEEAKDHSLKAISLCPAEIKYHKQLAQLLIDGSEEKMAASFLKKVIATDPADIDALWMLGQMSLKHHGPQKARHFFEMILNIEPCHDGARRILENSAGQPPKSHDGANYGVGYQGIEADADLSNIRLQATRQRMGRWKISMDGLTIFCHDLMSFYIAAKDIFRKHIYDFQSTSEKPVVIDGGGHIGLFILFIKQKYPKARMTVFEPDRESIELLEKNLQVNQIFDVKIVPAGLYKIDGTIAFGSDHSDGSSIFSREKNGEISVVRLGEYLNAPIDFLKLNIEGAELDVLTEIHSKLDLVKEMVIEYHGFSEIGQRLHEILTILDQAGFRYLVNDFDEETNPASKPPFYLDRDTRFFLLIYAKKLFAAAPAVGSGTNNSHEDQKLRPVSRKFGFDRGIPIDRYYIENHLRNHEADICGRVLEIAENTYTVQFGLEVTRSDVLHVEPGANVTIVGDLVTGENIPKSMFDCIILTQTLNVVFDFKSLLENVATALKPGGVLLITAPGISQISRYDMDRWGDYWRFTDKSLSKILSEAIPGGDIIVEAFGNVAAAKAFLDGRALHEIDFQTLAFRDPDYQLLLTARAQKPGLKPKSYPGMATRLSPLKKIEAPLILLYHRVANDPIDSQLLTVSPKNFEEHLKILSDHYRVLSLYELIQEVRSGNLQPGTVALTFDDGYLDNLTNAVPLLEKLKVPATIFITSGMLDIDKEFWWDALEKIFWCCNHLPKELRINHYKGQKTWRMDSVKHRLKAYEDLGEILKGEPHEYIRPLIEKLFDWAEVPNATRDSHKVLSPSQLKKLASSPAIEIGSHSVSHTRLSLLSTWQQHKEIFESKQKLETIINKSVRYFSYPFGTQDDFTKTTVQLVAEAGYEAGIANIQANVYPPIDFYAIPRRLVRNWVGAVFSNWLSENKKEELEMKTVIQKKRNLVSNVLAFQQT